MWRSTLIRETLLCQRYVVLIILISLFSTTFIQTTRGSLGVKEQRKGSIAVLGNQTQVYVKAHDTVKRSPLSSYIPFVRDRSLSTVDKAESRGYQNNHGHGWGGGHYMQQHYYHQHDNNMDLYSLLGGLSFASLLGATIVYLARRNTSGRRRRSLDSVFDDEDDELTNTLILDAIDTKY